MSGARRQGNPDGNSAALVSAPPALNVMQEQKLHDEDEDEERLRHFYERSVDVSRERDGWALGSSLLCKIKSVIRRGRAVAPTADEGEDNTSCGLEATRATG